MLSSDMSGALIYLVYQNVSPKGGKECPSPGKDCHEILSLAMQDFVTGFDILVGCHQKNQVSTTKALHQWVHFVIMKAGVYPLARALIGKEKPVCLLSAQQAIHETDSFILFNGNAASQLQNFPQLNFDNVSHRLDGTVGGQCKNSQECAGYATEHLCRTHEFDLINGPQQKKDNVSSGTLKYFTPMSSLLDEVDPTFSLHPLPDTQAESKSKWADPLFQFDDTMSADDITANYLTGLALLSNQVAVNLKDGDMKIDLEIVEGSNGKKAQAKKSTKSLQSPKKLSIGEQSKARMTKWLEENGIDVKHIVFGAHIDNMNGCQDGFDCLITASSCQVLPPNEQTLYWTPGLCRILP